MTILTTPSLTTAPLWARTRAMFARAVAATGGAAAIAAIALLTEAARRAVIRWLAPLEHAARKLLLVEAAALAATPPQPNDGTAGLQVRKTTSAASKAARRAARALDLTRPETWPARFSFALPRDPRAVPDARAPRIRALWGPPPPAPAPRAPRAADPEHSAFRLARRFEALRRVLDDPRPHAQRLACALRRARRRFPEIVRRYALAPARTNDYDPRDERLGIDACALALAAPDSFLDSS